MPILKEKFFTVEDIYNLPQGERAELIDGRFYRMDIPSRRHQEIAGELYGIISNYFVENNGFCKPYIAPFAVFLNEDDKNYVEPDISVICDQSKLSDRGCEGAPDWVIEIVSPSSQRMDYMIKLFKYQNAGVKEYWIVDPGKDRVMVYNFTEDEVTEYSFRDVVKSGLYHDLEIDFSQV